PHRRGVSRRPRPVAPPLKFPAAPAARWSGEAMPATNPIPPAPRRQDRSPAPDIAGWSASPARPTTCGKGALSMKTTHPAAAYRHGFSVSGPAAHLNMLLFARASRAELLCETPMIRGTLGVAGLISQFGKQLAKT